MARVLVLGYCVVPGPDRHGVQLAHVIRALASRFAVDVLTLRSGDLAYVERFHKTRMLRVPVPEGALPARIEAFRRAVRRQLDGAEYDVVHFRDAISGAAVMERRAQLGYGTVFDVATSVQGEVGLAPLLKADLLRDEADACERADLVLTSSDAARKHLCASLPAERASRVMVVPPGVDCDRFDVEAVEPSGPPLVVYTGSLAPGQGVRVLLRAWRDVVQATPARLCLVGPLAREFMEPIAGAMDSLGLAGSVELMGPVDNDELPRLISRAAVCVVPAAVDQAERPLAGFPTRLLEHLACARAVVAPRRSSVREVIQDGVEGLLFDPQSPRDLADKILRLLADAPLRQRLGEAGQRRARSRFPASALRRRVLEAYATLLPPSAWAGVGLSHPRGSVPEMVSASTSGVAMFLEDPGIVADTSPVTLPAADELESSATVVTPAPVADPASPSEPWLVIAGDGSITRAPRFGKSEPPSRTPDDPTRRVRTTPELVSFSDVSDDRTLQSPTAPAAPAAPAAPRADADREARFVAGELDVPVRPPSPVETGPFVAAGQLLGQPDRDLK